MCDDAFACILVGRTTAPDGQLALHSGTKILEERYYFSICFLEQHCLEGEFWGKIGETFFLH